MKILSDMGETDLTKPKLSIGWFIGAVVAVVLLLVVYAIAQKGFNTVTSVTSGVPVVGEAQEFLMG